MLKWDWEVSEDRGSFGDCDRRVVGRERLGLGWMVVSDCCKELKLFMCLCLLVEEEKGVESIFG